MTQSVKELRIEFCKEAIEAWVEDQSERGASKEWVDAQLEAQLEHPSKEFQIWIDIWVKQAFERYVRNYLDKLPPISVRRDEDGSYFWLRPYGDYLITHGGFKTRREAMQNASSWTEEQLRQVPRTVQKTV